MPQTRIKESDISGQVIKTYILDISSNGDAVSPAKARLDVVPAATLNKKDVSSLTIKKFSASVLIEQKILPIFLPHGYPHTVTPDYTPYQIYDSLQAFTSTIASLLASRAVLQSLGIDDNTSKSTATYATLLSIAQATISNLSTIYFAHHASSRIAPEVKFYRFLADIVNDIAFVLDCLSPSIPRSFRVPVLCLGAACRSICGVAGGSAKAELSAHFAQNGNIGELNAKDSSQETVVNLIGMWVGGVVVSRVEGVLATWFWLLGLLALHLWFNYCAVQSVRLRTLNKIRAQKVLSNLIRHDRCPGVNEVGANEEIFRRGEILRTDNASAPWTIDIGKSFTSFVKNLDDSFSAISGSVTASSRQLEDTLELFSSEKYLLSINFKIKNLTVALKDGSKPEDQIKAWCHAMRLAHHWDKSSPQSTADKSHVVRETLKANNLAWHMIRDRLTSAGWDISTGMLETNPGLRLSFE